MALKKIKFRMSAYSDAAGKYNPQAPLNGNEDNFYVDDNLGDGETGHCITDQIIDMTEYGCLMAVADGMGGMNAGEVASELAIDTVRDFFSPMKINSQLATSAASRKDYLEMVIKEADLRIKNDAKNNPEHENMGSTIILAWIVGDEMTISWCGDSRAYRYNPINGIELLSRDHSYVQELANKGIISYEDTFSHPQGNIITRSLGDPNNPSVPETREFNVYDNDIILICSDGLSGVLRDRKTMDHNGNYYNDENIEDTIAANCSSMAACRDALMQAAERADWYDNVTILLCQVIEGAGPCKLKLNQNNKNVQQNNVNNIKEITTAIKPRCIIGGILCIVFFGIVMFFAGRYSNFNGLPQDIMAQTDSLEAEEIINDGIFQGGEIPNEHQHSVVKIDSVPCSYKNKRIKDNTDNYSIEISSPAENIASEIETQDTTEIRPDVENITIRTENISLNGNKDSITEVELTGILDKDIDTRPEKSE